jgi:hypothetical protein
VRITIRLDEHLVDHFDATADPSGGKVEHLPTEN